MVTNKREDHIIESFNLLKVAMVEALAAEGNRNTELSGEDFVDLVGKLLIESMANHSAQVRKCYAATFPVDVNEDGIDDVLCLVVPVTRPLKDQDEGTYLHKLMLAHFDGKLEVVKALT